MPSRVNSAELGGLPGLEHAVAVVVLAGAAAAVGVVRVGGVFVLIELSQSVAVNIARTGLVQIPEVGLFPGIGQAVGVGVVGVQDQHRHQLAVGIYGQEVTGSHQVATSQTMCGRST